MNKFLLASALLLTCFGTAQGEPDPFVVPTGKAPTIDGVLADGEWAGALHVRLEPEGEAWLRADDTSLYVAVKVGRNSIPSLAITKDDEVRILHASASLGTAVYEETGDGWKATQGFTWRCRDGRTTDEDRQSFLEDEDWVGTTCGVGTRGEAEYRIERCALEDEAPRLAIVACRLQPMPLTVCAWPSTVEDGTRRQDLLMGRTPSLTFDPRSWARLSFGQTETAAERFASALESLEQTAGEDPLQAYRSLLDLRLLFPALAKGSDRARALETKLMKHKAVQGERAAQRRLDKALALAFKKLREVESKHPGTRAAERAAALREGLGG